MQLTPVFSVGTPANPPAAADFPTHRNYFYVIGNPLVPGTETGTGIHAHRDPVSRRSTRSSATAPPTPYRPA